MSGERTDFVDRAKARVGTTIGGKYRVDRILGIGGMAAVFAATHRNGHRVALKLLNPDLSARADMRARFRREGQAANTVNHPGVVVVIDDDIAEDGSAYLVMELLDGEVVEGIWERSGQRLPAGFVLALGRELCAVLAAAHRAGIVHRDLKPENLFVTREGKLKVLDFGLAQLRDAARPKDTHTGMVFGTPAFMPPEQASGRTSQLDARTDLWAVGATMFTLLSGAMVHEGESAQHFVMLAATEPARPLAEVLPNVHSEIATLVDRALTFDKGLRWQSAEAMREAIRAASRLVLGDADLPLVLPLKPSDPARDEKTRVGHVLAPVDDTLPDADAHTRIRRLPDIDTSAPPTLPKGNAAVASPFAALAMASDTPTKEREIDEELATRIQASPIDSVTEPEWRSTNKLQAQRQDVTADLPARAVEQQATWQDVTANFAAREVEPEGQRQDVTVNLPASATQQQQTAFLGRSGSAPLEDCRSYLPPSATPPMSTNRRDPRVAQTMPSLRKRDATTVVRIALAVLMVIATPIGFFYVRDCGGTRAVTQVPTFGSGPTSAAMAPSAAVVSLAPVASPAAETTVTSAALAPPTAPPMQVPTARTSPAAQPSHAPTSPRPVLTAGSTLPPSSRPPLAVSSRCVQPFELDDAGIKHWKTECLQDTHQ